MTTNSLFLSLPLFSILAGLGFAQETPTNAPKAKPELPPAAREPAAPKAGTGNRGSDPFTRDGRPPQGAEGVAGGGAGGGADAQGPLVVYGLVEYIEVPAAAWLAYSREHPVGSDATPVRAEVQKWIAAGKAKPVELTCVVTKSGQRMVVESIVEWRYPTEFMPATPTPIPTTFETRNTNFAFEWEPVVKPDGRTLESNFVPQLVRYGGSQFWTPMERKLAQPADVGQPMMLTTKTTISIETQPSKPALLQVSMPYDAAGKPQQELRYLVFFKGAPVRLNAPPPFVYELFDGQKPIKLTMPEIEALLNELPEDPRVVRRKEAIRADLGKKYPATPHMLEVERLEVTLADLNAWFAERDLEVGTNDLRKAALEWIGAGRGREVDRITTPTRSGNRQVAEMIAEFRYPSEFSVEGEDTGAQDVATLVERLRAQSTKDAKAAEQLMLLIGNRPPTPLTVAKNPVVTPSAYETRNTGYTLEVEPVTAPDGVTDISIAQGHVQHCGNVVAHRREVDGKFEPDIEQPIFATMKTSTSTTLILGQPSLLTIQTPADDQGRPEPQRRIVTFLTMRK